MVASCPKERLLPARCSRGVQGWRWCRFWPQAACRRKRTRSAPSQQAAGLLEPSGFFYRVIIEIRFAVHGEQHGSAGRRVVMQRASLAPDVISGRRHSIVIFDAALQDERLLDFGVFVKRDVSAWFELE
jgi:hypothetical protein